MAWRRRAAVILTVWLLLVLATSGCSSKGEPATPETQPLEVPLIEDPGMFRAILYGNDYQVQDDPNIPERNVDISNVVFGHNDPNGWAGLIKQSGMYDEYTYTVATWRVTENGEDEIYFNVLYRDSAGDHESVPKKVYKGPILLADFPYRANPTIASHLRNSGVVQLLVVDIVFQGRFNLIDNWEIRHTRYIQHEPGNFDAWDIAWEPFQVTHNPFVNYTRPDLVFDAAPDDPGATYKLHLVFEALEGTGLKRIIYIRGYPPFPGAWYWVDSGYVSELGINERPRIDVGWDDSGLSMLLFGTPSIYYVGIVWNRIESGSEGTKYDVMFAGLPSSIFQEPYIVALTESNWDHFNVFPQIELDPIENIERTTFIIWTETSDEGGSYFPNASLRGINTHYLRELIVQGLWDPEGQEPPTTIELFPAVSGRNGFPTLATAVFHDPINHFGHLAWLHDCWPDGYHTNCTGSSDEIKVWAGRVEWDVNDPGEISSQNPEMISEGVSTADYPYVFGPEIAIIDGDEAKCIWTDKTDEFGVYGDESDG